MAFTNNFRIERIYFEKLKSNIDILKSYIEAGATGEALELLKNSVDVDGAVLLLYRNLGEAWAELADLIQKTQKDLKDLADKTEAYHDELNERIDEVNNYLMALIRELDARVQVVEQDLATMNRNKFYDLIENDGSYLIEKDGVTVSFDDIKADADFPHDVILRYDNGTSVTELEIREFTDSRIDFYSIGLADSDKTVKEILVSIADTEAVTYSENTLVNPLYTFGTGLSLDSDNELSVDFSTVQAKLTEGTGIDINSNNEISVDTTVIQEKLTEGTGIDIDSSNNISVDTTVIQEKLSAGFGIDIDANNEISVDTDDVQEKLIAGQNITLTPDSTDPTKTVIDAQGGASYSAGKNIQIANDVINGLRTPIPSASNATVFNFNPNKLFSNLSNTYNQIGSTGEYYCRGDRPLTSPMDYGDIGYFNKFVTECLTYPKSYTQSNRSGYTLVVGDYAEADCNVIMHIHDNNSNDIIVGKIHFKLLIMCNESDKYTVEWTYDSDMQEVDYSSFASPKLSVGNGVVVKGKLGLLQNFGRDVLQNSLTNYPVRLLCYSY